MEKGFTCSIQDKNWYKKLVSRQVMAVRVLIKPQDYHIEPEKYCQGKLNMTWTNLDTAISMSFINKYLL